MFNLYKRGRVFWAQEHSGAARRRWSLKTRDRHVAENLLRGIELAAAAPEPKCSLYEKAAGIFASLPETQHVPAVRTRERLMVLRRKYNLDFEQLDELIKKQCGLCLLCFNPLGSDICVDHRHGEEGVPIEVRGILHRSCNVILGAVEIKGRHFAQNISLYLNWT